MEECLYTPGSKEAIKLGCACPVLDNGYGRGSGYTGDDGKPVFWLDGNCSYHNEKGE